MEAKKLSKEEIEVLKESFSIFDANGDGKIEATELEKVMRSIGQNPSKNEIEDMIKSVDIDKSGFIDFDEFLILMTSSSNKQNMNDNNKNNQNKENDQDEELRRAFNKLRGPFHLNFNNPMRHDSRVIL